MLRSQVGAKIFPVHRFLADGTRTVLLSVRDQGTLTGLVEAATPMPNMPHQTLTLNQNIADRAMLVAHWNECAFFLVLFFRHATEL